MYLNATIEHILPQKVGEGSGWVHHFPRNEERKELLHLIGNLVIIKAGTNSKASNKDFSEKKDMYFYKTVAGHTLRSPFAIMEKIKEKEDWTPDIVSELTTHYCDLLKDEECWNM